MQPLPEGPLGAVLAAALLPLSALYGLVVAARNVLYDLGILRVRRVEVPVISVGNITAGGTGKTPFVIMLAGLLARSGRKVAVVSRGYRRGKASKGPLVVSDGMGIKCAVDQSGDEPMLAASRLLKEGVLVLVCPDRIKAAVAAREMGAKVVVLDDGFQRRSLYRDIDIVLLDHKKPFHNGFLLPSGLLREPPSSLRRADMVVMTRAGEDGTRDTVGRRTRPGVPVITARHRPGALLDYGEWRKGTGRAMVEGVSGPVLLFSGIANPGSFEESAASGGLKIGAHLRFPDHHHYAPGDLKKLEAAAAGYAALVTTEKDAVRLPEEWAPEARLLVLQIDLVMTSSEGARTLEELIGLKGF